MSTIYQDIRFAFRMMVRWPGTSVLIILVIAFGIAANSTVFSLVNSFLVSPLPFEGGDRLVILQESQLQTGRNGGAAAANYVDWREKATSFESIGLSDLKEYRLGGDGYPERVTAFRMTPSVFGVVRFDMLLGRPFSADEGESGGNRVAIISYSLWKDRYASDPDMQTRTILLDEIPHSVVGVLPKSLGFLDANAKVWVPLRIDDVRHNRTSKSFTCLGLLKPGVSVREARAEMDLLSEQLAQEYPHANSEYGVVIGSLHDDVFEILGVTFAILHAAVGFVLLICCSIVASLLLTRSVARRREIAVRSALGATRGRITRQLLVESVGLSFCGGVLGLLLASWSIAYVAGFLPPFVKDIVELNALDGNVVLFTCALSLFTGILFGLYPALQSSRVDMMEILKEGGKWHTGTVGSRRFLRGIVIAEVALVVVLMNGAVCMVRSYHHLIHVDLGFNSNQLLTFRCVLDDERYPSAEGKRNLYRASIAALEQLPGVKSVAVTDRMPLIGGSLYRQELQKENESADGGSPNAYVLINRINPGYFETMNIPVRQGRGFVEADEHTGNRPVIIDELIAARCFPDGSPIGEWVRIQYMDGDKNLQIVGVVGKTMAELKANPAPTIYLPYGQDPSQSLDFILRSSGNPVDHAASVKRIIYSIRPDIPVEDIQSMDGRIAQQLQVERLTMLMLSLCAVIGMSVAFLGLYGIMSHSISLRTKEIGIRMALGAGFKDIAVWVTKEGISVAMVGVVLGLAASFALLRLLSSEVHGIVATDPGSFAFVALIASLASLAACLIPTRKAARIDPIAILRLE